MTGGLTNPLTAVRTDVTLHGMDWSGHLSTSVCPTGVGRPPSSEPPSSYEPRSGSGPANAGDRPLYGPETERALANFPLSGGPRLADCPDLVRGVVHVKIAAARANARLGALDEGVAEAVVTAAREVLTGHHGDQFPLPVVQGGGGTSTHTNVNEVLAALATRILGDRTVHPNDDVNRGQSTNDVMPTAIALAVRMAADRALPRLRQLIAALRDKAAEYNGLDHLGRTCLQDAVPLPVSAVHRSHAHGIALGVRAVEDALAALSAVPLGATAVGTGLGGVDGFAEAAVTELAELTGFSLGHAEDPYYALSSLEPLVGVAEALDRCGRGLARLGSDLRLLASGPVGGLGEVELPSVQAGSSIMPGKVNPVLPELLMQVSFQTSGEATSARLAASAGELEVSAMAPVVSLGLLAALDRVGEAAAVFAERCVAGLRWNEAAVAANLAGSLAPAVLDSLRDGYDEAAARVGRRVRTDVPSPAAGRTADEPDRSDHADHPDPSDPADHPDHSTEETDAR